MDTQEALETMGLLLNMTEQQQKTIAAAVEDLKRQNASLSGLAPELQKAVQAAIVTSLSRSMGSVSTEAQAAVKASVEPVIQSLGGVVAAASQAEEKLNRATAKFTKNWLAFIAMLSAGAFTALLVMVNTAVWWERSELESLQEEQATIKENVAKYDKIRGRIRLSTCDNRPCAEVENKKSYSDAEGRVYYILKGVK